MTENVYRWERKGPREMGSADRAQRGMYAIRVCEELTGDNMDADGMLTCPLTGERFHVTNGEVDKANPALGYVPGNVCMVSKRGNQGRSTLQQHHDDMPGANRYVADVQRASARVGNPLAKSIAVPLWRETGRQAYHTAVLAGQYGTK